MNHKAIFFPVIMAALAFAAGCDKKPDGSAPAGSSAPAASAAAKGGGAKSGKKPDKPKPAPKAQAKAELDKKPEAKLTGEPLEIPGTNGAFTTPTGWHKSSKGDFATSFSGAGEAFVAASPFAKDADPTPKLQAVASTLELSECEWKDPSDVTIGDGELPAKVADGECQSGDRWVEVMYALIPGDDLNVFVFGAVTDRASDAEKKETIEVLRSIHKK